MLYNPSTPWSLVVYCLTSELLGSRKEGEKEIPDAFWDIIWWGDKCISLQFATDIRNINKWAPSYLESSNVTMFKSNGCIDFPPSLPPSLPPWLILDISCELACRFKWLFFCILIIKLFLFPRKVYLNFIGQFNFIIPSIFYHIVIKKHSMGCALLKGARLSSWAVPPLAWCF